MDKLPPTQCEKPQKRIPCRQVNNVHKALVQDDLLSKVLSFREANGEEWMTVCDQII